MKQRKLIRIVGLFCIIAGIMDKSVAFATAVTEQQLQQRATTSGSAEFMMVFGLVMIAISFFIKNRDVVFKIKKD